MVTTCCQHGGCSQNDGHHMWCGSDATTLSGKRMMSRRAIIHTSMRTIDRAVAVTASQTITNSHLPAHTHTQARTHTHTA
jgi:hypothetical protein